jgi:hypothetical protein
MKIYQAVQKLLLGDTWTDTLTGDLISLLSLLESRLARRMCWVRHEVRRGKMRNEFLLGKPERKRAFPKPRR